jgi:23S rRNA (cytosine1962-C5)-methyltransferase
VKIALAFSIATFVVVKNDNSISTFPQGFTRLVQLHIPHSDYQLLDFGQGRKLEQIHNTIVDRPCPGANVARSGSALWQQSHLSFDLTKKESWYYRSSCKGAFNDAGSDWVCRCESIRMHIKPTPAGQIGIFPEHWAHWPWLKGQLLGDTIAEMPRMPPPRVLSLFAYTGATTLAMADYGCEVTHVDASKPTVQWAKQNAVLSGMSDKPIRWIVDDASAFVKRELRRNRPYEAILLDPPTYGHGAQGDRWEIHRDLLPLLEDCWQLLSEKRCALLLCGHSSNIDVRDINKQLSKRHGKQVVDSCEVVQAHLTDQAGRKLDCGFAAKYSLCRK